MPAAEVADCQEILLFTGVQFVARYLNFIPAKQQTPPKATNATYGKLEPPHP